MREAALQGGQAGSSAAAVVGRTGRTQKERVEGVALCADCLLGSPRGQAAESRITLMADHLVAGPAHDSKGSSAFQTCLTRAKLRILLRNHGSSGWASSADNTVAAAALQPAVVLHQAMAQGAGTLKVQGVSTQAADWSSGCCGIWWGTACCMHCTTSLCSKAWLGRHDRSGLVCRHCSHTLYGGNAVKISLSCTCRHESRKTGEHQLTTQRRINPRPVSSPCREGDFARQQQTALKLHKLGSASGQHQYLWWVVTILVLQAQAATEPGGRQVEGCRWQPWLSGRACMGSWGATGKKGSEARREACLSERKSPSAICTSLHEIKAYKATKSAGAHACLRPARACNASGRQHDRLGCCTIWGPAYEISQHNSEAVE